MTGAASIAALSLAVVFGWAALAKAVDRRVAASAFAAMSLPVPAVLAVVVPAVEAGVAVALVVRPDVGGALSLATIAVFTLVVVRGLLGGASAGCGCFGSHRVEPVSPLDVIRNGLLAGLAVISTGTRHLVRPHAGAVVGMVAVIAAAAAIQTAARARLRPASPAQ